MSHTTCIFDGLKTILRTQKKTYKDVAQALAMTEAGVKKAFSNQSLSLPKIEIICALAGTSLWELIRIAEMENLRKPMTLSEEQEVELASDEDLFVAYYLILAGADYGLLERFYNFDCQDVDRILRKLDKCQLIEFGSQQKITLRSTKNPIWIEDGALERKYIHRISTEFLSERQSSELGYLRFVFGRLDRETLTIFQKKMRDFETEFLLASSSTPDKQKVSVGFVHALKPWRFSVIENRRKHPREGA